MCVQLRQNPELQFEQLMDLSGVDYAGYGDDTYEGLRFAVVLHLLSVKHNWRVRVCVKSSDPTYARVGCTIPNYERRGSMS